MIRPLLFLFLGSQLVPAAPVQTTQQDLQRVERGLADVRESLEAIRSKVDSDLKPDCSSQVQWQPGVTFQLNDTQSPIGVSVMSMVSQPRDACLPGEIRITANFYAGGEFVCSGTLSFAQVDVVQNTYLEFRPFFTEQFLKWRDAQTWEQSNYHRMMCFDREGIEVRDPANSSTVLKIFATVFPRRGGLASAEFQVTLPRPAPNQRPQTRIPGTFR